MQLHNNLNFTFKKQKFLLENVFIRDASQMGRPIIT